MVKNRAVYVHIPFCTKICSYCDFCKYLYNEKWVDNYLDKLSEEIINNYQGDLIKSIYIGGGTPTSLNIRQLNKLFSILKIIKKDNICEYTIETNIFELTDEKIDLLIKNGVNRVSIGIESFDENNLKILGRNADYESAKKIINLLKTKGIDNINIDLMYAIPGESLETLNNDIDKFINLDVNHISTYSLMIEPHTKIYIDGNSYIDDYRDYEMYQLICNKLNSFGYIHYEISNFSKLGYESKHNLTYWNNLEYYGFGLGASGYIDNYRYTNTKNINAYLKGNIISEKYLVSNQEYLENFFILGLRKLKGIKKEEFKNIFGYNIYDLSVIKKLISESKLIDDGANIYINPKYIYISNEILTYFIN